VVKFISAKDNGNFVIAQGNILNDLLVFPQKGCHAEPVDPLANGGQASRTHPSTGSG